MLLLGLFFLLLVIISSTNLGEVNSHGRVKASGVETVAVQNSEDPLALDASVANCRYGVVAGQNLEQHVSRIGAGWFLDFNPPAGSTPIAENGAEFVNIFKTFQVKTADGQYLPAYYTPIPLGRDFALYLENNPGGLWVIGNEVDRGPNPGEIWSGQGDMHPEIYAVAYHEVRAFIRRHDPTARTAISGLVQVTPSRLRYLDRVWNAYFERYGKPMPVDVWNMHIYVLPEVEPDGKTPNGIANIPVGTDPTLGKRSSGGDPNACDDPDVYCFAEHDDLTVFGEQVTAMRQWMKDHGQQQKPLILTEFSILYPYIDEGATCFIQDEYGNCFTPDRVSNFMKASFNYLNNRKDKDLGYALDENRLVQQWTWFSLYTDSVGVGSNILEPDRQNLTHIGKVFQQEVFAQPQVMNLLIDDIPKVVAVIDQSGKANVSLSVKFRNNGNTAINKPFTVTFYSDAGLNNKIGSTVVSEMIRGCTTHDYEALVKWTDLPAGRHRFWAVVDDGNAIGEGPPQQQDNLGTGLVLVSTESNYIPILR